jgi:hypothetical protein
MHLVIALFTIYATWRWGNWRNWKDYHSTMFYIASGGLLYEYLTVNKPLWNFHPDFLYNQTITVIVYAFVTMPLSTLIYLSQYPKELKLQVIYIFKWACIYAAVELVLQFTGRISYDHGWNFWHSLLFDLMMFPMLRLHFVRPFLAYVLSIVIIILLIHWFKIPIQ